ncbi:MAG: hypothetical protein WAT46_08905 [Saprospiraceae bacterium]|jgi:hypothetical protein
MESILKDKLINEQLSSVEFVQDYLQLHFDGRTITSYIWPIINIKNESLIFGDVLYRNALCDFIGNKVKDIFFKDKEYLVLYFEEIKGSLKIDLDPNNPDIVSEIAVCGLMKYVDSKNVENFSQICKYEYKKNEKSIFREL